MNVRIVVATHKKYPIPQDKIYIPVLAGAALYGGIEGPFLPDNTGENISIKNPGYCELTALYWAWKNVKAEYIGLCHYRRYFYGDFKFSGKKILASGGIEKLLADADVLLPFPRHYLIETNYSQYIHAHHSADLCVTREVLSEKYPEYVSTYDVYMSKRSGHRFNMFVMKADLLDSYCSWLFDILFELEARLDVSYYSDNDKRVFGFVAERLLDVWLIYNKIPYRNVPYVFLEKQHWCKKIFSFCLRKIKSGEKIG